jgi:putative FmdB family regulatory protein
MPIREFCCARCGHEFETLIFSRNEMKTLKCPKCGRRKLTSLFSVFGVSGAEKKVSTGKSCTSCGTHNCSSCN